MPDGEPVPAKLHFRHFVYYEALVGLPVFFVVLPVVAWAGFTSVGGWPVALFATFLLVVLVWSVPRKNYSATLAPDGTLTFMSLTRRVTTNVREIDRISMHSAGGRGGFTHAFHFRGTNATLGGSSGRSLAKSVVAMNPTVVPPG